MRELLQVKQREYAEQRLRVEAEDQLTDLERESRAEVDRLSRRLSDSELESRKLAGMLESVQRELAEAEQAAGAEISAAQRDERMLRTRVSELERRSHELNRSLEVERAARERTERLLESTRRGHRALEALIVELNAVVGRLKALAGAPPAAQPPVPVSPLAQATARQPPPAQPPLARAVPAQPPKEQAEAQPPPAETSQSAPTQAEPAAAARIPEIVADTHGSPSADSPTEPAAQAAGAESTPPPSGLAHPENGEMVDALAAAVERLRARVAEHAELAAAPVAKPPSHKHSQSLITRWRIARKQRRAR
jgi:hypothetical protein